MEVKYYQIAGLCLCILSEFDTLDSEVTRPFMVPSGVPDVICRMYRVDALPETPGKLCQEETLMEVHQEGDILYRSLMKRADKEYPYMLSQIVPGQDIVLWALKSELSWSNQMGYIFLTIGLGTLLLERKQLVLHASVVETKQGAILFTASSGTGKSTQADLWRKYRHAEIVNGDRCAVGLQEGKSMVFGVPMAGTSGISQNKTLPIRGIVVLEQATENRIRQLYGAEALLRVGFGAVINRWEPKEKNVAMDILSRILEQTPVFLLQCLPEESAVDTLEDALEALI